MAKAYQGSIVESLGRLFATGTATAMGEAEFGAVMFAIKAPWIAAAFSLCFAVANVVGTALWSRRDRLRPYVLCNELVKQPTPGPLRLLLVALSTRFGSCARRCHWSGRVRSYGTMFSHSCASERATTATTGSVSLRLNTS
jgi:hypothetical protein